MRKLFALLFVAGTLSFASCSEKKAEETTAETVDTTAHVEEAPAPVDTTTTTAPAPADTNTAAPAEAPAH